MVVLLSGIVFLLIMLPLPLSSFPPPGWKTEQGPGPPGVPDEMSAMVFTFFDDVTVN
ncbi:MAG: hypothetical protein R2860_12485 [Desulfobacterales bacterium]